METLYGDTDGMPSTRDEAIKTGAVKYFTAVPCRNEHLAPRYTVSGGCIGCLRPLMPKRPKRFPNAVPLTAPILIPGDAPYGSITPELVAYFNKRMLECSPVWWREWLTLKKLDEPTSLSNILETALGGHAGGLVSLTAAGFSPVDLVNQGFARRITPEETAARDAKDVAARVARLK